MLNMINHEVAGSDSYRWAKNRLQQFRVRLSYERDNYVDRNLLWVFQSQFWKSIRPGLVYQSLLYKSMFFNSGSSLEIQSSSISSSW